MPYVQQPNGTVYSAPMTPQYVTPAVYSPAVQPQPAQAAAQAPAMSPVSVVSKIASNTGTGKAVVNSAGSALGFGQTTPATFVGPMAPGTALAPGALGTSSTLGSVAGAAGLGYLGGGALARATGGSSQAGSLGGAVGGALGSYAAGTAGVAALGAGLGLGLQSLNFVVPGLGILAGGLAGSLLTQKNKGTSASDFAGSIDATGGLAGTSYGSKNSDNSKGTQVASATSDYYRALKDATGVDFTGEIIRGGLNTKQMGGGYLQVDARGTGNNPDAELGGQPQSFKFNVDDPMETAKALGDSALFLGQRNKLTEDQLQKIQEFNQQRAIDLDRAKQGLPTGANVGSSGVPMIDARKESSGQSFADFYSNYKKQQTQGTAV